MVYWWSIGSRLDNARTHSNHQNDDDRLEREANRENTADVFKYSFHLSFSVMIICHCIHLNPCFFCWQVEVDKCRSNIKVHESFFEHCQLIDLGRQVNNDIGANKSLLTPNWCQWCWTKISVNESLFTPKHVANKTYLVCLSHELLW